MTLTVPPAVSSAHDPVEHVPMPESLGVPSREVLDLALVAIDGMQGLDPADRAHEEEEVIALLDSLDTDERRGEELQHWLRVAAGTGEESRYSILARLMGVPKPEVVEEAENVPPAEVGWRLETQGFVKEAPKFATQLTDESREEVDLHFDEQTFSDPVEQRGKTVYPTTELRAIRALNGFLGDFITKSVKFGAKAGFAAGRSIAKSMRKNLTYIGGKEFNEGSYGLGDYWSEYLTQDDANQIFVVTTSSLTTEQRRHQGQGMSDDFIRDQILGRMIESGVSADVMDRIITDPRKISGDPANVKIVFVDDWVVSGRQMRNKIRKAMTLIGSEYHDAMEINVLAAPPHLVAGGLGVDGRSLPVKAYYRAHRANPEDSEDVRCHITGTHATVNFGFSVQIERMKKLLNENLGPGQRAIRMPAAASVYRDYWPVRS